MVSCGCACLLSVERCPLVTMEKFTDTACPQAAHLLHYSPEGRGLYRSNVAVQRLLPPRPVAELHLLAYTLSLVPERSAPVDYSARTYLANPTDTERESAEMAFSGHLHIPWLQRALPTQRAEAARRAGRGRGWDLGQCASPAQHPAVCRSCRPSSESASPLGRVQQILAALVEVSIEPGAGAGRHPSPPKPGRQALFRYDPRGHPRLSRQSRPSKDLLRGTAQAAVGFGVSEGAKFGRWCTYDKGTPPCVRTPWDTYVPLRGSRSAFVEHARFRDIPGRLMQVSDFRDFVSGLCSHFDKQTFSTLFFSDGFERAFQKLGDQLNRLQLAPNQTRALQKSGRSYDRREFAPLRSIPNSRAIIGENARQLCSLVHAALAGRYRNNWTSTADAPQTAGELLLQREYAVDHRSGSRRRRCRTRARSSFPWISNEEEFYVRECRQSGLRTHCRSTGCGPAPTSTFAQTRNTLVAHRIDTS